VSELPALTDSSFTNVADLWKFPGRPRLGTGTYLMGLDPKTTPWPPSAWS